MIVTLTGTNSFALQADLHRLVADFIAKYTDMALERLDGDEADIDRIRESIQSLPFLTARKMIILREPSKQKAVTDDVATLLTQLADTTDLIIVEPKLDKRLSYYKTLKKLTDFREFSELDAGGLARWAVGYAKERGGALAPTDATFLVNRIGPNQQLLKHELDKLLSYKPGVTKQAIELLCEPLPQSTIFDLIEAAFAGRTERAFALYKEQRALKVEPQAIIAMIAWQLHILVVVKAGAPRSVDEIAKAAKLNPFVVRKSQPLVRSRTLADLKQKIADLLQLDRQLKSTAINPDDAVQLFILTLPSA